ncbi:CRAL/TRIO domain-containing protein [Amniculicola lignicola CBS 123094]|uniref:CRAL/TRIO domain-containing protein n=1 Tax=Amniculicola lignicola CBS 123094 TaxID=1392246 RepID=A0A6A5X4Z7_9PLEO|nr:CRAL/TRIO domain-containing protein [Amniculicola lignicola CBS 123094]
MFLRVPAARRTTTLPSTALKKASHPLRQLSAKSPHRITFSRSPPRVYNSLDITAPGVAKRSGTGFFTVAVVFGIAVGGALLYPLTRHAPQPDIERQVTAQSFEYAHLTDSYLVMAPNVPPGRPGTLTPEQEAKLRDFWAATMRVFGVYESPADTVNESETNLAATAGAEPPATVTKDKEKKKSKLNVFRRNKGDKSDKDSETASGTSSGTATPADSISHMSLEENDKHGQTKDFRAAIANISPEDLRAAFWGMVKHDHPDGLLLRFLRARKWDIDRALVMMVSTMHWRMIDMHVDDAIMQKGELAALEDSKSDDPKTKKEGEDFLAQIRMGKSFLHGLDKEGRPCCVVRARLHRQGEQSEASVERYTVYTIETARMLLRPPVDTATIIFDMTNFSMANMDYAPVKFMIKCFEANYPESLGAVLVYKAPWVFNAVWSLIRGWLDPVVAGKVHFVKNPDELENFIPRTQMPAELGGDEKWEYTYEEPPAGENDVMKDEATRDSIQTDRTDIIKKYESAVLDWIHAADVSEERRKERDTLAEELRQNYWKLDPYIRARSFYDRIGVIGQGGKLDFYPAQKKENGAPPVEAQKVVQTSQDDLD